MSSSGFRRGSTRSETTRGRRIIFVVSLMSVELTSSVIERVSVSRLRCDVLRGLQRVNATEFREQVKHHLSLRCHLYIPSLPASLVRLNMPSRSHDCGAVRAVLGRSALAALFLLHYTRRPSPVAVDHATVAPT